MDYAMLSLGNPRIMYRSIHGTPPAEYVTQAGKMVKTNFAG
jgi:hypothetical protein